MRRRRIPSKLVHVGDPVRLAVEADARDAHEGAAVDLAQVKGIGALRTSRRPEGVPESEYPREVVAAASRDDAKERAGRLTQAVGGGAGDAVAAERDNGLACMRRGTSASSRTWSRLARANGPMA